MLLAQKEVSRGGRGANGRECDDMRIGPIPLYNIFYSRSDHINNINGASLAITCK